MINSTGRNKRSVLEGESMDYSYTKNKIIYVMTCRGQKVFKKINRNKPKKQVA